MGCDIHCYIEHREDSHWESFGGCINPGRYYQIFERMAGVRGDVDHAIVKPRGLPDSLGSSATYGNRLFIDNSPAAIAGVPGYVSFDKAKDWVQRGLSKIVDEHWVTNPDYHSHSWLTPDEFEKCLREAAIRPVEYAAILAAMRSFENSGRRARLVFWFDN